MYPLTYLILFKRNYSRIFPSVSFRCSSVGHCGHYYLACEPYENKLEDNLELTNDIYLISKCIVLLIIYRGPSSVGVGEELLFKL